LRAVVAKRRLGAKPGPRRAGKQSDIEVFIRRPRSLKNTLNRDNLKRSKGIPTHNRTDMSKNSARIYGIFEDSGREHGIGPGAVVVGAIGPNWFYFDIGGKNIETARRDTAGRR